MARSAAPIRPRLLPCAYCGQLRNTEREHVIPRALYPLSKALSRVQRITIPACRECNGDWSDDEVHFRNMLLLAGENPNGVVQELWETTARRSFTQQVDGERRMSDLVEQMVPVGVDGRDRHMIYPGRDERVMRIVRKIVRGLSHHHGVETAIADECVWADIVKYEIPAELLDGLTLRHVEADIIEYWYDRGGDRFTSTWFLRFFGRVPFVAAVSKVNVGVFPDAQ